MVFFAFVFSYYQIIQVWIRRTCISHYFTDDDFNIRNSTKCILNNDIAILETNDEESISTIQTQRAYNSKTRKRTRYVK